MGPVHAATRVVSFLEVRRAAVHDLHSLNVDADMQLEWRRACVPGRWLGGELYLHAALRARAACRSRVCMLWFERGRLARAMSGGSRVWTMGIEHGRFLGVGHVVFNARTARCRPSGNAMFGCFPNRRELTSFVEFKLCFGRVSNTYSQSRAEQSRAGQSSAARLETRTRRLRAFEIHRFAPHESVHIGHGLWSLFLVRGSRCLDTPRKPNSRCAWRLSLLLACTRGTLETHS